MTKKSHPTPSFWLFNGSRIIYTTQILFSVIAKIVLYFLLALFIKRCIWSDSNDFVNNTACVRSPPPLPPLHSVQISQCLFFSSSWIPFHLKFDCISFLNFFIIWMNWNPQNKKWPNYKCLSLFTAHGGWSGSVWRHGDSYARLPWTHQRLSSATGPSWKSSKHTKYKEIPRQKACHVVLNN